MRPGPGFGAENPENPETPKNRIFSKIPGSGPPGPEKTGPGPARVRTLVTLSKYLYSDIK